MPHPRRSQQCRSPRPRGRRHHDRSHDSRRIYVAEGRTLLLLQTRAILDLEREGRVERAETAIRLAEKVIDVLRQDLRRAEGRDKAHIRNELQEHKAVLADALWESEQARRASRPAAVRVTLEVTRLPPPRTWSNALPGGTSPRRAVAAQWTPQRRAILAERVR